MITDFSRQTVLVTGASSGIGRRLATAFAERGASLVLVARRADRLARLAEELAVHGTRVEVVPTDLAGPDVGRRLHAEVTARGMRVTGLVNNAGFATYGPLEDADAGRLEREVAVDVLAPVLLTHAFLPDLLAAPQGFLVNVASMAAYQPSPRMPVYGAAKAFVLSFTEALWTRTRRTGLTVFALSPGATATEFNDVVGTDEATAGARPRQPEDVVATALAHLARRDPGPSVIDGRRNRVAAAVGRLLPRRRAALLMDRISDPDRRGAHRVPA